MKMFVASVVLMFGCTGVDNEQPGFERDEVRAYAVATSSLESTLAGPRHAIKAGGDHGRKEQGSMGSSKSPHWIYQNKQVAASLLQTIRTHSNVNHKYVPTVMSSKDSDGNRLLQELKPFDQALKDPPGQLLGEFALGETHLDEEECRDAHHRSWPTVIYRFQRAALGKKTKGFIRYTKRPAWVARYNDLLKQFDSSGVVSINALYRDDVIVYEIISGSQSRNKHMRRFYRRARHAIKDSFSPSTAQNSTTPAK